MKTKLIPFDYEKYQAGMKAVCTESSGYTDFTIKSIQPMSTKHGVEFLVVLYRHEEYDCPAQLRSVFLRLEQPIITKTVYGFYTKESQYNNFHYASPLFLSEKDRDYSLNFQSKEVISEKFQLEIEVDDEI